MTLPPASAEEHRTSEEKRRQQATFPYDDLEKVSGRAKMTLKKSSMSQTMRVSGCAAIELLSQG